MSKFDQLRKESTTVKGMQRALEHAAVMHLNGKLSAKQLNEFQRYIAGKTVDEMSMDDYAEMRRSEEGNKKLDLLLSAGGFDDDQDAYEGTKARKALVQKVVGDLAGQLWNNGQLDDDGYLGEMEKIGHRASGDDKSKGALALYEDVNGISKTKAADAGPDETNAYAAWRREQPERQRGEKAETIKAADPAHGPDDMDAYVEWSRRSIGNASG
jgi:hypothetical protein